MKNVLVVAPHPDDETLGCGGTLLKHKYQGDAIHWLIVTTASDVLGWSREKLEERKGIIEKVAEAFGFDSYHQLGYPATRLDTVALGEMVESISKVIQAVGAESIYLQNRSDVHTDHQLSFDAVYSCTKSFRFPFVRQILMYEVISETDFSPALQAAAFVPNVFVDVTEFFKRKIEILKLYAGELMDEPFTRSIESVNAQARLRGSRIGVQYAEAFQLLYEHR